MRCYCKQNVLNSYPNFSASSVIATITHWGILWWWLLPRNLRLGLLLLKKVPESFHSDGHFSLLKRKPEHRQQQGGKVWLVISVQFANSLGNADVPGEDHVGDASLVSLLNLYRNIHQTVSECSRRMVTFLSKVEEERWCGQVRNNWLLSTPTM